MNQTALDFSRPSLTPQSQRLLERLKMGEITNVEMRDELKLLSYTRRLFEVKKHVEPEKTIIKRHIENAKITRSAALGWIALLGFLWLRRKVNMKVTYCVRETLTYSGEIEIDEETYNDWKDKDEDTLGNLILDMIDRRDPQDWEVDSVDDFEPVDEDAKEGDDES